MMSSKITRAMIDALNYNTQADTESVDQGQRPVSKHIIVFVFKGSDLDAAAYYVARSLANSSQYGAVPVLYVQESCEEEFVAKLKTKAQAMVPTATAETFESYKEIGTTLEKLNARTVKLGLSANAPLLVYHFNPEYFVSSSDCPLVSGFEIFRTIKESISLSRTGKTFENVSIWCENHSAAYEIIANTEFKNIFINCFDVSLEPLSGGTNSCALIEKSFHYERLQIGTEIKKVVFPIGITFAN